MINLLKLGAKAPKLAVVILSQLSTACSLYQSEGRKFIASNALPLAGLAQKIELACHADERLPEDLETLTNLNHEFIVINNRILLLAQSPNQLVVLSQSRLWSWCHFTYASEFEKQELVDLDRNLAILQLSTFGQDP